MIRSCERTDIARLQGANVAGVSSKTIFIFRVDADCSIGESGLVPVESFHGLPLRVTRSTDRVGAKAKSPACHWVALESALLGLCALVRSLDVPFLYPFAYALCTFMHSLWLGVF